MSTKPKISPVEDTVSKVNEEVAVGENLEFQRRWWRFERVIWLIFSIVIVCDLVGLFGRGWLAKAQASVPDKSLTIEYDRVQRVNTPSTMTLHFGPGAIRNRQVKVYLSDSVVEDLGAQTIAPQPASSAIGRAGITYIFPATIDPAAVRIQLQPAAPGSYPFRIQVAGKPPIDARLLVMP
jgi:hypothetical protein